MPLFISEDNPKPGDNLIWVAHHHYVEYRGEIGQNEGFTRVPATEIWLGTIDHEGRPFLWYRCEQQYGTFGMNCYKEFTGDFHPKKGWNPQLPKHYITLSGRVSGRITREDPYEVFDYLRRCLRGFKYQSTYFISSVDEFAE